MPFERVGSSYRSFFRGTWDSLVQLWSHRELQVQLVRRELKVRYKDSSLGFLWTLIKPIMLLLIYYFAIGLLLGARDSIPMFAIFVFAGLTIWGLYNDILTSATVSILTNAGLIKKVYVPRELFPIASVVSSIVNFGAQILVLIAAMIIFGQFVFTTELFYAIPAILVVMLFSTSLALLFSAFNVYLRDVQYLVDVVVPMLFWASPIVYSFANVHKSIGGSLIEQLYLLNPITVAVIAFQRAVWLPGPEVQATFAKDGIDPLSTYPADLDLRLLILCAIGTVFLWFSHRIFLRLQGNFAQEI
jgi:ABC-2 type transport system permease protein